MEDFQLSQLMRVNKRSSKEHSFGFCCQYVLIVDDREMGGLESFSLVTEIKLVALSKPSADDE